MTQNGKVPFVDLVTLHRELEPELLEVCKRVIQSAGFTGGPEVEGFEREFAQFCDTKFCVGVNSGTDALRFALIAAGIGPGDIVLTVPNTFIATTEAISQAGARPDFVDIDGSTFNMNPDKLRHYLETQCVLDLTGRCVHRGKGRPVTAVVPVHLYGQMADMDAILDIAQRFNLIVVEDACQAHGAEYFSKRQNRWLKAGAVGCAAAFSFYPGKNLGACGEGGAITTNDEGLARKSMMLRDHGSAKKYYHEVEGYNGRLDSIQAGMLRIKLRRLGEWNKKRQEAAQRYDQLFSSVEGVTAPYRPGWSRPVYHVYAIRTRDRGGLQKHLADAGIDTGIHYPVPLHLQKAYVDLGYHDGDFSVAEKVASEILSLPMYPNLKAEQQACVLRSVLEFVSTSAVAASR